MIDVAEIVAMIPLSLLAEISRGDVFFENNNLLCYATKDIYWNDIFANAGNQKLNIYHDVKSSPKPCKS